MTGNHPGKARIAYELRADFEHALRLVPGLNRLNLHAIYLEFYEPVARNTIKPKHFSRWVTRAKEQHLELDFNHMFHLFLAPAQQRRFILIPPG
ncbi:MAG: L-rhamnose isomerase [Symbiopectobacterium sp.]